MARGGYRQPSNPAPVSGPGALSQRTDGGATQAGMVAPGGEYGERQELEGMQAAAAMQGGGGGAADLVPINAPSAMPDQPITAGAPIGAGIGPQAAGIPTEEQASVEQLRPLLPSLEFIANLPQSNPETRAFVRRLKAAVYG